MSHAPDINSARNKVSVFLNTNILDIIPQQHVEDILPYPTEPTMERFEAWDGHDASGFKMKLMDSRDCLVPCDKQDINMDQFLGMYSAHRLGDLFIQQETSNAIKQAFPDKYADAITDLEATNIDLGRPGSIVNHRRFIEQLHDFSEGKSAIDAAVLRTEFQIISQSMKELQGMSQTYAMRADDPSGDNLGMQTDQILGLIGTKFKIERKYGNRPIPAPEQAFISILPAYISDNTELMAAYDTYRAGVEDRAELENRQQQEAIRHTVTNLIIENEPDLSPVEANDHSAEHEDKAMSFGAEGDLLDYTRHLIIDIAQDLNIELSPGHRRGGQERAV